MALRDGLKFEVLLTWVRQTSRAVGDLSLEMPRLSFEPYIEGINCYITLRLISFGQMKRQS